ncbi:MAG: DUF3419 family protein [Deltaproteobacteria bacterium]|nr:DUF3419 family protein [Deltaproteobacteria bacterium]
MKFAAVREDPELEAKLVERSSARAALVVASGGCTALTLAARFPELQVTAFDFSPRQLELLRKKEAAMRAKDRSLLNVEDARLDGLNQDGCFEAIFRVLSTTVRELVADASDVERLFDPALDAGARTEITGRWFRSKYWPAAFEVAFAEPLLHAMFGPDATQHAERGSYPGYFQRVFERGLTREGAARNPYLQHVFLGAYRNADAPEYARCLPRDGQPIELVEGTLLEVPDLATFGLVSLSNIFDWSNDSVVESWAERLRRELRRGAYVLVRQLNNRRDLSRFFAPEFAPDDVVGKELFEADRSLFYERIWVARRQG